MSALPAIIIAQLLAIILIVNSSSALPKLNQVKHSLSKVLGVQIAQEVQPDTPITQESPSPEPTNESQNPPSPSTESSNQPAAQTPTSETTTPSAQPEQTAPEQSSPYNSPTPDNPNYFNDIIISATPTPAPSATEQPSPAATPGQEPSPTPQPPTNPQETSPMQTQAVLNPQEVLNAPETISQQVVDEVKKEEDQISQTTNPADQTKLLINFAADKVKDINNSIKNDDFSSTNFASQRFNDNIDQALENLPKLPPTQAKQLQRQLIGFCAQADFVLRSTQLQVPEEAEQDLEINRAKCLSL